MNRAPGFLFAGYVFDGAAISFQASSLYGLDSAESHPTRGDWRDLAFSLCSTLQTRYNGMSAGEREASFRARAPQQFPSSLDDNAVSQTYSFDFIEVRELANPDVIAEAV